MRWLSLVGTTALVGSVTYVYCANHGAAVPAPLSTTYYCMLLFAVYLSGMVPPTPLLPRAFYRANVFALLYRLYCTKAVGYYMLRRVLHQPSPYPHSDYRFGVRCLSDCGLPLRCVLPVHAATHAPATTTATSSSSTIARTTTSAAAAVAAVTAASDPMSFYGCGGGVIDTTQLGEYVQQQQQARGGVLVVPVPMFADNYAYLIVSLATCGVAAVDPADPHMVLRVLQSLRKQCGLPLVLTDVLTTHKHWDHAGGNAVLAALARTTAAATTTTTNADVASSLVSPDLVLVGSHGDAPLACTRLVRERDGVFAVARGGVAVQLVDVPGHTSGSVMYVVGDADARGESNHSHHGEGGDDGHSPSAPRQRVAVFTGDSLFVGGCGAPFETTSLSQVEQTRGRFVHDVLTRTHPATRAVLPPEDVLLYVGHEYAERLLSEVHQSMQHHVRSHAAHAGCHCLVDEGCVRYANNVARALGEVRMLRVASDGLADVADVASSSSSSRPLRFTLPVCTVPTTLAREACINPLLTLSDEAFAELRRTLVDGGDSGDDGGGGFDARIVEQAIFTCSSRTASAWPARA